MNKNNILDLPEDFKKELLHTKMWHEDCTNIKPPKKDEIKDFTQTLDKILDYLDRPEMAIYISEILFETDDEINEEDFVSAVSVLQSLSSELSMRRFPDVRGRNPLPAWMYECTDKMIDFYKDRTGVNVKTYHADDNANLPANDFSKWFHNTMLSIFPEMNHSQCKTLLERRLKKIAY